jgi:choline dehydrogenase
MLILRAYRLSVGADVTIALIEAGGSHKDYFESRVLFLASWLIIVEANWNYTTTSQVDYTNTSIAFQRGHVLGGSSTVNAIAYDRASNETSDRWAEITADAWSS